MLIHLHEEPFNWVKSGGKTLEKRLYDEKRKKIKIGDIIEIESRATHEIIKTKVIDLKVFKNFEELYAAYPPEMLGSNATDRDPSYMEQFYSKEDQEKYGVIAIEIELIK